MKRSKVAVFLTMALAILAIANVAHAQTYTPPPWSGVMDTLGSSTIHSGSHWAIGDHQSRSQSNTDLGALQTINGGGQSNNLILPVSTLPAAGDSWTCGPVGFATDFIESNQGYGIRGIAFQAAFNSPSPNLSIFESVFFNEDQCYGAGPGFGREYGIFLDAVNNQFYAYWGTNINRANVSQAQTQIGANILSHNTLYNWYMYPVTTPSGCSFEIYVTSAISGAPVYDVVFDVDSNLAAGPPIRAQNVDPNFCTYIVSDNGYISANIQPVPADVSGSVPIGDFMHLNNLYGGGIF
ncbi:MAG TPA: hypothetical protein VKT33_06985 [Candidatus Angelobacter sp.]|nr:hypothetical protein [Candidatus Angelobacter sp.]